MEKQSETMSVDIECNHCEGSGCNKCQGTGMKTIEVIEVSKDKQPQIETIDMNNLPEDLWHWYYIVYQTKKGIDTAEVPVKWPIRSMNEVQIIANMIGERLDIRTVIVTNWIHLRVDTLPDPEEGDQR